MNKHIFIVFLAIGLILKFEYSYAQNTPGDNFDLGAWKLQTLSNLDSSKIEVNPINTYTSNFFYTNSADNSMVFRVPSNGGTTTNASYPRVELRQMTAGANWALSDTNEHYLTAQCRVMEVAQVKPKVIIGQIHGSESNSEMLKIRWTGYVDGNCFIEARFQTNDNVGSEYGVILASGLSLGDTVNYTVTMIEGVVTVTINGNSASQTYTSPYYGTTDNYYFKAGSYIQWNENIVGSTIVDGVTLFYKLSLERAINRSTIKFDKGNQVAIYPNPAKDYVILDLDLMAKSNTLVEIIDLKGSIVKRINLTTAELMNNKVHKILLNNLNSGIYFIRMTSDELQINRKLIISD